MATKHENHDWEALLQEHAQLRHVLLSVRDTVLDRTASPKIIGELLEEMRRMLLEHFRQEEGEDEGYLASALAAAPELSERAARLLEQHRAMAQKLQALSEHAAHLSHGPRWWEELQAQFTVFLQEFSQHEAAENQLLHDAFSDDVAAED